MNNRQVLEQLRKGSWVDASAALRAIDRREMKRGIPGGKDTGVKP